MRNNSVPVILVHGWNSHPGAWKQLVSILDQEKIPFARFDHSGREGQSLEQIASALGGFIRSWREDTGSTGPVDIVSHSVGTCITRYYLEVCDGTRREEKVRQLIGLGPPNNGSALAELFVHPVHGPAIINRLTGIFVPAGFDPAADVIVQDVRPKSPFMERLRCAGTRPDIIYRIIVTANPEGAEAFFPLFSGKTWVMTENEEFFQTLDGDGIVAHAESALPGISLDIIPLAEETAGDLPPANQYCHINMTKNPLVNDRILFYLTRGGS
ncbi:MAG: acetyltransferase [Methanomicrobiales archaeon HGW-Methanomicrobiales-3]|jgi:pimeloyl-ACP methyl ester carboxylesterase|nr:MAG: acetyltransferase [Methanomicrobiales archaeon HGW-Methanomicrobiales-3]